MAFVFRIVLAGVCSAASGTLLTTHVVVAARDSCRCIRAGFESIGFSRTFSKVRAHLKVAMREFQGAQGRGRRKARSTGKPKTFKQLEGSPLALLNLSLVLLAFLLALPWPPWNSLKPPQDDLCQGGCPNTTDGSEQKPGKGKAWGPPRAREGEGGLK